MRPVHRQTIITITRPVLAVLTLSLAGSAAAALQDTAAPPATVAAERGGVALRVSQSGRIDSAERRVVHLDPEAYSGGFEISEIAHRGGGVKAGDVLLRFDTEDFDRQVEDAQIALDNAKREAEFAVQELDVLREANQVRVERATAAKTAAEHAFEIFDKYEGDEMLRRADLAVKQSEYRLEDQKEELEQLKSMYEDSTLASETKEIVIKRNERQIAISEEYLQMTRNALIITRDYTYPDRKQSVDSQLRWATIELQHALLGTKMAEARKVSDVDRAQRTLRDAEKKLADLQADRSAFELKAAASGILTPIDLKIGDTVRGEQKIAEIVDPQQLIVTFNASPADLRVLRPGLSVNVSLPAYPEVELMGEVSDIAAIGQAQGNTTNFPVKVKLARADDALVRVGLECQVTAERIVPNVLRVPADAVKEKDGKHTVTIARNGETEEREIVIGAKGDDFVQVVKGLREGDQVVVK